MDDFATLIVTLKEAVTQMRDNRDMVRRELCERIANPNKMMHLDRPRTPQEVAEERGWDCFKEETK